jgi:hypothetical protein
MNRSIRFENAYTAVANALLTGTTYTWAALLDIATAELTERSAFLAEDAVNRCILAADGSIGPDIMAGGSCDGDESTFTFQYIGR